MLAGKALECVAYPHVGLGLLAISPVGCLHKMVCNPNNGLPHMPTQTVRCTCCCA